MSQLRINGTLPFLVYLNHLGPSARFCSWNEHLCLWSIHSADRALEHQILVLQHLQSQGCEPFFLFFGAKACLNQGRGVDVSGIGNASPRRRPDSSQLTNIHMKYDVIVDGHAVNDIFENAVDVSA